MGKGRFILWVSAVFAVLMLTRASLMPRAADYLPLGRAGTADLSLAVAIIAVLGLTHARLRESGLSLLWLVAVFLWLAACEPLLRMLLGGPAPSGGYPGGIQHWNDMPLMLLAFLFFAGFYERADGLRPRQAVRRAELIAGLIAAFSLISRVFVVASGIDRLPFLGDYLTLSSGVLTALLQFELWMGQIKGLFLGLPDFGNMLIVICFCGALIAIMLAGRFGGRDRRQEMLNA